MWKILFRICKEHLALHLAIPLFMGLVFNAVVAHFLRHHGWALFARDLLSGDNLIFAAGVMITYAFIMYRQIKKETAVTISGNDLAVLEEELETASNYFATGAIGVKEWFDPVAQEFLSIILKRKLRDRNFCDERVLLIANKNDMAALDFQHLDGYYAERLVDIHVNCGTPLGFLGPSEVREVLGELSPEDWQKIRAFPRWFTVLPGWTLKRTPRSWFTSFAVRQLDFAFLTHKGDPRKTTILLVTKEGENLSIRKVDQARAAAYAQLVTLIKKRVHKTDADPPQIDAGHDFAQHYRRIVERPFTGTLDQFAHPQLPAQVGQETTLV